MGKKANRSNRPSQETVEWLSSEIQIGLQRKWIDHVCVMYGQLLEVLRLTQDPELRKFAVGHEPLIREFIFENRDTLATKLSQRSRELAQMVRSDCSLVNEQLMTFLSVRSDILFAQATLASFEIDLTFEEPPSDQEIHSYLTENDHEYPSCWPKKATDCMDLNCHWWWKVPPHAPKNVEQRGGNQGYGDS